MDIEQLIAESDMWEKNYFSKDNLGHDEELQMFASAYANLFLKACANKSKEDLAEAHQQIAKCFAKVSDKKWTDRHNELASAYLKQP
jgi:hypothetical protein